MANIPDRRGFLRQLAALPMLGGGVTLIGSPTAAAEPVTDALMWSYKNWLHFEHRMLSYEMVAYDMHQAKMMERSFEHGHAGDKWHFQWSGPSAIGPAGWQSAPQPSTRAPIVLSAVGCDWRRS